MIKQLKARLRAGIKHLYLRHVWPAETEGTPWSIEEQLRRIRVEHMQLLGNSFQFGLSMETGGPMGEWIAGLMATLLRINDGVLPENYRECQLEFETFAELEPGKRRERVALTIQRCKGLTPHEARQKAEWERDDARRQKMTAEMVFDEFKHALALAFDPSGDTDCDEATLLQAASMVNELRERAEKGEEYLDTLRAITEKLEYTEEAARAAERATGSKKVSDCLAWHVQNKWLSTIRANAELGTAHVESLCEIGQLRSIIWHFAIHCNLPVADAMKKLLPPQQDRVQTIWREAREAQEKANLETHEGGSR